MQWTRRHSIKLLAMSVGVVCLGVLVAINVNSPEFDTHFGSAEWDSMPASTPSILKKTIPENLAAVSHTSLDGTWAEALTPEQIKKINQFVGADKNDIVKKKLPGGGYQLSFGNKYRHAVVLQRDQSGHVSKHEVGPSGIKVHHEEPVINE